MRHLTMCEYLFQQVLLELNDLVRDPLVQENILEMLKSSKANSQHTHVHHFLAMNPKRTVLPSEPMGIH